MGTMGKTEKISLVKMHLFRGISPMRVLTSQKETSCDIVKMAIFQKFFNDFMRYIIG